jgi:hypothetical protein
MLYPKVLQILPGSYPGMFPEKARDMYGVDPGDTSKIANPERIPEALMHFLLQQLPRIDRKTRGIPAIYCNRVNDFQQQAFDSQCGLSIAIAVCVEQPEHLPQHRFTVPFKS